MNQPGLPNDASQRRQHEHQQTIQEQKNGRRRLKARRPVLDEATQQKHLKSYLGGLFPPVDKAIMPLYLRDTSEASGVKVLDLSNPSGQAVATNSDLVFFWHIPKASGSTMKNILNFCFDLKRAEQVKKKPVSYDELQSTSARYLSKSHSLII